MQRLPSGAWRIQYRVNGTMKSATFPSRQDASDFLEKRRREVALIREGLDLPKKSTLVLDHSAKYLRLRFAQEKHSTASTEERYIKIFVERLGLKPMRAVTTKDIREFLDRIQVEKNWANATRNRARAYLHIMFQRAFEDEDIMTNPVARIPMLQENPTKKVPLTQEEADALIASAGADFMRRLFLCVLVYQGPRVSEALGLDHGDFDLKHGYLNFRKIVEQSTGKVVERLKGKPEGITVPLLPVVRSGYLSYLSTLRPKPSPSSAVFINERGKRASTFSGKSWVGTARRHAVLGEKTTKQGKREIVRLSKAVTPHVLRATFASLAEEKGMPREVIQKLMGHSSLSVTARYVSRRNEQIRDVVIGSGFGAIADSGKVISIQGARK